MFYKPEFIIYLWLLPVTFMIVIPAALSALQVIIRIMKEAPAKEEYVLDQQAYAQA